MSRSLLLLALLVLAVCALSALVKVNGEVARGTAAQTNHRYKYLLEHGQTGLTSRLNVRRGATFEECIADGSVIAFISSATNLIPGDSNGIPDVFGTWAAPRGFYEDLVDANCIQEFTQIWWSVRPHHAFGTVELRICDGLQRVDVSRRQQAPTRLRRPRFVPPVTRCRD